MMQDVVAVTPVAAYFLLFSARQDSTKPQRIALPCREKEGLIDCTENKQLKDLRISSAPTVQLHTLQQQVSDIQRIPGLIKALLRQIRFRSFH